MSVPSGVARLLGIAGEDAFSVLGLPVGEVSPAEIEAAKKTQLARIEAHPQRHTPAAEDAILAVHAAAAQLEDAGLRARAIKSFGQPAAQRAAEDVPMPSVRRDVPESWSSFARQAGPVLAHAGGGLNRRSLSLLALLASRHGLEVTDIPLALRASRPTAPPPPRPPVEAVLHIDDEDSAATTSGAAALRLTIVLVSLLASVVVLWYSSDRVLAPALVSAPVSSQAGNGIASMPEALPAPLVPQRPEDPLEAVVRAGELAPDRSDLAISWLAGSYPAVATDWLALTPEERDRVRRACVRIARMSWSSSARLGRVFDAIAPGEAGPDDLARVLASAEVASAIAREPDRPRATDAFLRELVSALPGHAERAEPSSRQVISSYAEILAREPSAERYRKWLSAAGEGDAPRLLALDLLLTRAEHPPDALAEPIALLLDGLALGDGTPLARWLLRAFRDPSVTTGELHGVTRRLVLRESVDAFDASYVLAPDASPGERTRVREMYRVALDPSAARTDRALVAAWGSLARATLARMGETSDVAELLEQTLLLSRLSEAARWIDEPEHAGPIVRDLGAPVSELERRPSSVPSGGTDEMFVGGTHTDFVIRFERIRRSPRARLSMLIEDTSEFDHRIAAPVAELIAEIALLSTEHEEREAALSVVLTLGDAPVMLNALLETLPRASRSVHTSAVIETATGARLPHPDDPGWPGLARGALVAGLLESLSASGPSARIGALSGLLDASYGARAAGSIKDLDGAVWPVADRSAKRLLDEALQLGRELPSPAGFGVGIEEIERRARGRIAVARGSLERFAAMQASLLAVRASVLAVEDPSLAGSARGVLDRVSRDRDEAGGLMRQIRDVERGFVELWLLRFGEGGRDAAG